MNIDELQIQFLQKIGDINPVFINEDRPSSFVVANYFNKAIKLYLQEKFLNVPSFEHRLVAIDSNLDELNDLITSGGVLYHASQPTTLNWNARAVRYRMPDDVLIPISLSALITRQEVIPMIDQLQFVKFVSRRQAEKIVSDSSNKVIHVTPVAFFEDEYFITVVGDAYVDEISANELVYLRKPYNLSFEYAEITGNTNLSVATIGTGVYFRAMSNLIYNGTAYAPGSKILKVAGQNTVTGASNLKVGYPWGETNTPDFPEYTHMKFVDMAVQLYINEAKLLLVQKQQSK